MQSDTKWTHVDTAAASLYVLLLAGEATADRQMFAFQTEKYRRIKAGLPAGDYAKGFIDTGLWGWSRHPNYFCEVGMWWAFYLFSVGAAHGVGCVLSSHRALVVRPLSSLRLSLLFASVLD